MHFAQRTPTLLLALFLAAPWTVTSQDVSSLPACGVSIPAMCLVSGLFNGAIHQFEMVHAQLSLYMQSPASLVSLLTSHSLSTANLRQLAS